MEVLIFILLAIILVLIISLRSSQSERLKVLEKKIDYLFNEVTKRPTVEPTIPEVETGEIQKQPDVEHQLPEPISKPQPEPTPEPKPSTEPDFLGMLMKGQKAEPQSESQKTVPEENTVTPAAVDSVQRSPAKPGFFERNPDLEKFIGENLANKIGIAILVLGIGFFVKYAIDQDWINEIGRVFIGILCGGLLLGIAHKLRGKFHAFSSVLVGGGIAVLYLTIAIAFHEYRIFSQVVAFSLMLGITAFSVVFALGYNRIELAILSILGGFASPFMVSTGEGNYIVLFTYILILDTGMLVLSYYKKWNLVNVICYAFTILLFGSWLSVQFHADDISMIRGGLIFATIFYLVFFAMNIINNLKERTSFQALEFSVLLSNTFLFYAAGMTILNNLYGEDFKGLFTASLGVFNFIFAFALYKSQRADKNLVFLLIGLVLTFISLAAPVQLRGNHITLFWSAETVLLLWLSQKSGIRLMKLASLLIMGLMVISLVMDWAQIYSSPHPEEILPIIFNKGFITGLFAVASIVLTIVLLKFEKSEDTERVDLYRSALVLGGIVILYATQILELRYQLNLYVDDEAARHIILGAFNMLYILALIVFQKKLNPAEGLSALILFLGFVAMGSYLLYYTSEVIINRNEYLVGRASSIGFGFHYILDTFLVFIFILTLRKISAIPDFAEKSFNLFSWFFVFFLIYFLSAELDNLVVLLGYSDEASIAELLQHNRKIGYPILWGLTSFLLIAAGLKRKKKHLRIISLTLFLITLLKLFLLDIRGISEGGKIAAFISLGILLLTVSFMYQRLKRLLLADETEKTL